MSEENRTNPLFIYSQTGASALDAVASILYLGKVSSLKTVTRRETPKSCSAVNLRECNIKKIYKCSRSISTTLSLVSLRLAALWIYNPRSFAFL
jgi:hypothetical protein